MGSEEQLNLTFLKLFDNTLSKYVIFKRISFMQRDLGRAFGTPFLHIFSIKMFLI